MPARILVVEDDAALRRTVVRVMRSRFDGCAVDVARDGEEGLSMVLASDYDVVVSDIHMPRRSGSSMLAEAVRRGLRVGMFVFVSGEPDSPEWSEIEAAGATIILKPFHVEELAAACKTAIPEPSEEDIPGVEA